MKDAVNVLFVINDTTSRIETGKENIANGEREIKTPIIEPRTCSKEDYGSDDYLSVGLYIYTKAKLWGVNLSFFGSLVGISFKLTQLKNSPCLSVGMDCPNSFFGGTNSIRVVPRDDPYEAAGKAMDSHNTSETAHIPGSDVDVLVKRSENGPVNWGICHVKETLPTKLRL